MDATGTCDGVYSVGVPRKSSASSTRSCSATERCRQELEDCDVEFDVRPPSGTNHQVLYFRQFFFVNIPFQYFIVNEIINLRLCMRYCYLHNQNTHKLHFNKL